MTMTQYGMGYKVQVGDILKGKRTGRTYEVIERETTKFPVHDVFHLICRETQSPKKIAEFALHFRYEVIEK